MNYILRKFALFFILILFTVSTANAQLITNGTFTPAQLVQNVLLGAGVTVSNVTFTGITGPDTSAIGKFTGTTNIGLDSGIIMTTGTIYHYDSFGNSIGPQGPNDLTGAGIDNGQPGYPLLDSVSGGITHNAAVLEFDFIPVSDTVKFRYVFGSDEYPEYVCSTFNDVFGFFISGINPAGGNYANKNIALIPGTSLPVAINTVNPGVSGGASGGGICTSLAYSSLYVDNTGGLTIQYDGFTTVLTAIAAVQCGTSYHIKIAISDVGDGIYDSGVFLDAGSLTGGIVGNVTLNVDTLTKDSLCPYSSVVQVTAAGLFGTAPVFTWDFGDATVLSGSGPGPYQLSWTKAGSKKVKVTIGSSLFNSKCSANSDSVMLTIGKCQPEMVNVITPNGDGINDHLEIKHLSSYPHSGIEIYNRWGNLIYQNSDYQNNWPIKNDESDGTYYYIVNLSDGRKLDGFFTLLR